MANSTWINWMVSIGTTRINTTEQDKLSDIFYNDKEAFKSIHSNILKRKEKPSIFLCSTIKSFSFAKIRLKYHT